MNAEDLAKAIHRMSEDEKKRLLELLAQLEEKMK
jgi:DNA polymerase III delta subunit